jgi:hypothetical protein
MQSTLTPEAIELLPFWVTYPDGTDGLKIVVGIVLVLVLLGFGALYFTIQTIPDRMASGMHKIQMQFVGVLGLISLFTMNNAYWIAAILVAAVPLHELIPSLKHDVPDKLTDTNTQNQVSEPDEPNQVAKRGTEEQDADHD